MPTDSNTSMSETSPQAPPDTPPPDTHMPDKGTQKFSTELAEVPRERQDSEASSGVTNTEKKQ